MAAIFLSEVHELRPGWLCFSLSVLAIVFVLGSWSLRRLYRRLTGEEFKLSDYERRKPDYD